MSSEYRQSSHVEDGEEPIDVFLDAKEAERTTVQKGNLLFEWYRWINKPLAPKKSTRFYLKKGEENYFPISGGINVANFRRVYLTHTFPLPDKATWVIISYNDESTESKADLYLLLL